MSQQTNDSRAFTVKVNLYANHDHEYDVTLISLIIIPLAPNTSSLFAQILPIAGPPDGQPQVTANGPGLATDIKAASYRIFTVPEVIHIRNKTMLLKDRGRMSKLPTNCLMCTNQPEKSTSALSSTIHSAGNPIR